MTDQSRETEKDKGWPGLPANMPLFADLWDDLKSTDTELCLGNSERKVFYQNTQRELGDEKGFVTASVKGDSPAFVSSAMRCTAPLNSALSGF
jgi:hypothetical protein